MTKCILIIDDEMGIRKITQISLNAIAGWKVLEAASGKDGLAIAQSEQPDAILLDVMMPGMDGINTLSHLRENPKTASIPVVFLTAKAQVSEQEQFAKLPVAGIITKPFKASELVMKIRFLLNWE